MSLKKIIAIIVIFLFSTIAWMILGVSNLSRTDKSFYELKGEVVSLYGDDLKIKAPQCYYKIKKIKEEIIDGKTVNKEYYEFENYEITKSDIKIKVNLDQRKKGNLWFPTFKVQYTGYYEFKINNFDNTKAYYLYATLEICKFYL